MASTVMHRFLPDEIATIAAGYDVGHRLQAGMTVFLEGTLGAGKTTITRGLLQALGHSAVVKSPTYTLVESYEKLLPITYHFDLYRLGDPEELEYMGIRDYFSAQSLCIVEWAERGQGYLPSPDLTIKLSPQQCEQTQQVGRHIQMLIHTESADKRFAAFGSDWII